MNKGMSGMADYEDESIVLDPTGIRIKSYRWPGDTKHIRYNEIRDVESFEMGFWTGRHRLVGLPLGRPRNWFHWGRHRRDKTTAVGLDLGRWIRPTLVPERPVEVADRIRSALDAT